jgi:hypothetical protein
MINRQTTRGTAKATNKTTAKTKSTTKAKARTQPSDAAGARASANPAAGRRNGASRTAPWKGDEVSSKSRGAVSSAEEAATRAEGSGPVRADALVRQPDQGTYLRRGPARRPRANGQDTTDNANQKRQNAAEEHATAPSRRSPYGKL